MKRYRIQIRDIDTDVILLEKIEPTTSEFEVLDMITQYNQIEIINKIDEIKRIYSGINIESHLEDLKQLIEKVIR